MRFIPAFVGAVLITAGIFLFMQSLIKSRQQDEAPLALHKPIDIIRQQAEREREPPPEDIAEPAPAQEPSMEPLQLSPLAPQPSVKLQIPALDLASGDLAIAAVGKPFSAPLGTGSPVIPGALGTDAQGFIEVVPYSTRKPNVPELAWTNKISGWVLVAFNVSPTGHTRNVRILDARPRGVFEETVISAVSDWRYTIRSAGPIGGEIVMTQKVDVDWQDFPLNIPNVD